MEGLKARIDKMIYDYNLVVVDGDKVGTYTAGGRLAGTEDAEFLKDNKAAFIARIPEYMAEKAAEEKATREATITFIACGWEAHTISIDTRKDVEAELKRAAEYYCKLDAITYESLCKDYAEAVAAKAEKEAKAAAEAERIKGIKNTAVSTGEKQELRSYIANCNDSREECSTDFVIEYAMPDGTVLVDRQHTW
ncbi:MAG: hypothetical protein FWH42_01440 [Dehalococcoidia bacterium]|nr:hypothetical protein [Dehalococcoidia bacterium]